MHLLFIFLRNEIIRVISLRKVDKAETLHYVRPTLHNGSNLNILIDQLLRAVQF